MIECVLNAKRKQLLNFNQNFSYCNFYFLFQESLLITEKKCMNHFHWFVIFFLL